MPTFVYTCPLANFHSCGIVPSFKDLFLKEPVHGISNNVAF